MAKINMIDVDKLVASDDNFFEMTNIEELAETILGQGGIKENLIVHPIEDADGKVEKYEIISGHRRTAAVKFLLENGKNISRLLPCLVQKYSNDEKKLNIVLMNVSSRIISDSELWKSYEVVNEILQKKKELGEKFGKVQNKLSEILGISKAQVAKIQNIDHNAIQEVKQALNDGEMSIHTANELVKLDNEKQKEFLDNTDIKQLTPKEIKKKSNGTEKGTTNSTFSENIGKLDDDNTSKKNFLLHEWAVNCFKENYNFIIEALEIYLDISDNDKIQNIKTVFEAVNLIIDDLDNSESELEKIRNEKTNSLINELANIFINEKTNKKSGGKNG